MVGCFSSPPTLCWSPVCGTGSIVDMNFRFLEIMGYSREELIGRTPLELGFWVYPEDREVLMNLLREGRGHCSGFETTMRNKQGSEIPVLMSARVAEIDGESYVVSQSREDINTGISLPCLFRIVLKA